MISVENLSKSFGIQVLFEGVSFKINPRERIGLVGRNGHGKTTLLRLIAGEEHADSGNISVSKDYRIGYVRQQLDFKKNTILQEAMTGLPEQEKDHHWKAEKILEGLGFSTKDKQRHPSEFSGGFQVRLNLAKVLLSKPDLLLLDEPTNYLDITSIRWVEQFLVSWPHELILITHDRTFMDKIVTHTMGIHRKKVRKIPGDTAKFYTQIAQDEEIYEKTRINDERRSKEIEQFITRFRAKARLANMVQSRIKTLAKMEKRQKIETIKNLDFSFRKKDFPGKYILSAMDVSFSYNPDMPLIRNFNISIKAKDRICIVGKNGKGKTTLLKLLSGVIRPQKGEILCNPGVSKGIFEQTNLKSLVDTRTVEEEILYSHPDIDMQMARNICGAMMFEGDFAKKKIELLSGGEKSRVMLGKLLVTPVNVLLLDEPTNHLDMESCDSLLEAIDSFDGAVIIVTHNEMFLHAIAERLIVFQRDGLSVLEGTYQSFLEKYGWEDEESSPNFIRKDVCTNKNEESITKKEFRRVRSEFFSERSKTLKPLEERILEVEKDIDAREKELKIFNAEMLEASGAKDGKKIVEISLSMHKCQSAIDRLFDELEKLSNTFQQQKSLFQIKLDQLEKQLALKNQF